MRVAATDYDGTLCIDHVVAEETLAAITRWRAAGNVFGIVTGRDLSMVVHEVDRWKIPVDFLVCCNGAVVYDGERTLLHSADIPDCVVARVLRHPAALASVHYELCISGVVHLYIRDERSWFPKIGVPYRVATLEEAVAARGIQQISLSYFTAEEGKRHADALNESFSGEGVHAHQNKWCVDVTRSGVDKASGILELLRLRGWPEEGLLAIGDGENDLSMIRHFNGVTVPGAPDVVTSAASGIYATVGAMLTNAMP